MGPGQQAQTELARVGVFQKHRIHTHDPMTSTSIESSLSTAAKAEVSRQLDTAKPFVPLLARGMALIRALTAPPSLPALATGLQPLAPSGDNPVLGRARDYVLAPRQLAKPKPKTLPATPPLASA